MIVTSTWIMAKGTPESISNNNIAVIISLIALVISIIGWGVVYILNVKASNVDRKNNFQLNIYQNLLAQTNELIKLISSYTTAAVSHTTAMARVLNDYHSWDNLPDSEDKIDAKYKLQIAWLDAARSLAEQSFDMQYAIEDFMRYLDMNGTDYTKGTIVYDSLFGVKTDAYKAAERNIKRWNDHKEMDKLTPKRYAEISKATKVDADIIFDFGMCADDALTIIYNQSVSDILNKPSKQLSQSDARRIITTNGILDNRKQ